MSTKFLVNSLKLAQTPLICNNGPLLDRCQNISGKVKTLTPNSNIRNRHYFAAENIDEIAQVYIDYGIFKYLLLKVIHKEISGYTGCKTIIRGYSQYKYHSDIYEAVERELVDYKLQADTLGGGWIQNEDKKMRIYGTSEEYGRANHQFVAKILKSYYPFHKVTYEKFE